MGLKLKYLIYLKCIEIMQTTEQDYLELAEDCKNRIEQKNKEIYNLKKGWED